MTSVNVMMATGMRDNDTKDIPASRSPTVESEFEPGVKRTYVKVNFTEDGYFELYNTFGKKDVNERIRELNEGKKALRKHRIEVEWVLMVVQTVPMKYGFRGAVVDTITFFDRGLPAPSSGTSSSRNTICTVKTS